MTPMRIIYGGGIALLLSISSAVVLHFLFPVEALLERVRFSKVYYDRNDQLLGARLSPDDKWRFQSHLDEISPLLVSALLTFEDKRFYEHHGIDIWAALRAMGQNVQAGQIVSGASTITMQVARLLQDERNYHSWSGKLLQVFRAIQLELILDKEEILEWYFNLGPYGGNIEGVVAASWLYFQKSPSQLSLVEAIALAITPKSPNVYRPDRFPLRAQEQCRRLVEKMQVQNLLSEEDLWFVECDSPPGSYEALPRHTNHLIDRLQTHSGYRSSLVQQTQPSPDWNHIQTTIDLDFQQGVEGIVSKYLKGREAQGIHNASAIVIDNETSEVLIYLGSPDFKDKSHAGEVDGVRAARSPGSTLKPFIYARALESGQYNSHTLLANVPVSYPGYHPQNYSPEDLGIAHFDEALQQSLNLPAVALNVGLGRKHDLLATLWEAGVSTLSHSRAHYGQSLVLGGGELRLDELATLYSALATGGKLRPIRMLKEQQKRSKRLPTFAPKEWISPEAAFIISDILKHIPHPQFGRAAGYFKGMPQVAWKTGTSSRQRDAWTLGYSPQYTVGVWVGNFDGTPVEGMTGAQFAAPLFFEIFRFLNRQNTTAWPAPPAQVLQQSVCNLSGKLSTTLCPGETQAWWIMGVTEPDFCQMHIELLTDQSSGQRLSEQCIAEQNMDESQIKRSLAVLWPQTTGGWLAKNQSALIFPPYMPSCIPEESINAAPPILQTPIQGEKYYLKPKSDQPTPYARFDKIAFSASVNNEVNRLDWYLDGQKIASTAPGESYLWSPIPGFHELILVDDFGRATQARFQVTTE